VGFYLLATYLVGELNTRMTLPMATVFWISTTALMAMLVVIPLAGALSDRWGRKPLLVVAFLGVLLFGRNGFALTQASAPGAVLAGELVLALFYGIAFGITPVWIIEATSGAGRCTTIGLAYNLCTGVVGGLTPLVATLLVQRSGNILAPIWQWQAAAVISLAAVLLDGPIRIRQPRPASIAATEQDD
jgi:MHS family proline/betaine transporter-like MFS transporter